MAVQAAVELCIVQIKRYLSSEQLPTAAFNESAERGFHAAETFVQVQILVLNQTSGRKLNSTMEGGLILFLWEKGNTENFNFDQSCRTLD